MLLDIHYRLSISKRDHVNDSLIDDIPTFHGKCELYFNWILKLKNIVTITKQHTKEFALGKAQGAVIKCLKSLPVAKLEQC